MCVLLEVVSHSHYGLSVLSMSVIGSAKPLRRRIAISNDLRKQATQELSLA